MKQRIITPLSEFPTEAIVHLFKKNRHCVVNRPFDSWYKGYNKETKQHEYWVPFRGGYDETSKVYDPNIIGYTLMSSKEIAEKYTETRGNYWEGWCEPGEPGCLGQIIDFVFEGMYWKGTVEDVKAELSKRPNVNIRGSKDFRKWKIQYKKQLKK